MEELDPVVLVALALAAALIVVLALWLRARAHGALADAWLADRDLRLGDLTQERDRLSRSHSDLADRHGQMTADKAALDEAVRRLEGAITQGRSEIDRLGQRVEALQGDHTALQSRHAALQADSDGRIAAAEKQVAELRQIREEMTRRFDEIATRALKQTGADVSRLQTEQLTALLTPFRENVQSFERELRDVHGKADQERARLSQQITMLTTQSESIRSEAANLTRALKGDRQKQGAWGEMILERILENSGLERDVHYRTQAAYRDDEGRSWRPDVVVLMPKGKHLVIDSKVSLVAYEAAASAEDAEERDRHLRAHVASVRRHIDTLADKGYQALENGSVDYVLMFMPIEGALSEALRQQGDLTSYAVSKGVGIMTPTTLMVTLRTVEHIWTVERRESNAEAIAERAGKLYDKVAGFAENMIKVGDHLDKAVAVHGQAYDQLSRGRGNVLGQIDKLRAMGAKASKTLPVDFDGADDDAVDGEAAEEATDAQALRGRSPAALGVGHGADC